MARTRAQGPLVAGAACSRFHTWSHFLRKTGVHFSGKCSNLRAHNLPGGPMKLPRRQFLHLTAAAAALPAIPRVAWAQAYPARPVRVIVPFAPGGPTDVFARLIAQKLSEHLGKQFYVENIGGAGGNIGAARAAQAAPDGYTMLVDGANLVLNSALYPHVSYDAAKDFDPITIAV